jgi:hypothetical protein
LLAAEGGNGSLMGLPFTRSNVSDEERIVHTVGIENFITGKSQVPGGFAALRFTLLLYPPTIG